MPSTTTETDAKSRIAKVIQAPATIRLSQSEQVDFAAALLKPRTPNARLRKAAERYRRQLGT